MKYKIGNVEVEAVQYTGSNRVDIMNFLNWETKAILGEGAYIVKSEDSIFILSEQDFNDTVTKVKEPKFKVGDVAYVIEEKVFGTNIEKVTIRNKKRIGEGWLCVDFSGCRHIHIKALFTLEEAIEKLKEL